jgi:two-component system, chemotaxis family, response regulator Rcp1
VLAEMKSDPALRSIPVVVLSTSRAAADILGSYDLNANCYVAKPLEFAEFRTVVRAIGDFWASVVSLPTVAERK